jgi:proline dehydrogenase
MMKTLLTSGHSPAIATHDPAMIDTARRVGARDARRSRCVRVPDACTASAATCRPMLVNEGYRVRVYVPFGREWFPYFMRRLGESAANVSFVIRGIVGEQR